MIVVENGLHLNLCLFGKHIAAIRRILINGNIAVLCQFEDIGKEIHLLALRFHWIIETCILVLCQIDFAIDIASPYHFLRYIQGCREGNLGTYRHSGRGAFLLLLLLLLFDLLHTTLFGLSLYCACHQHYRQ